MRVATLSEMINPETPLTDGNLDEEIAALYEDLENWDHGHPMDDSIEVEFDYL